MSIGTADATNGHRSERFSDHLEACQKYNIVPDKTQYLQGYQIGLVSYCTPVNGFNVGRNGYSYRGICPAASEAKFLNGFNRGHDLHETEVKIASLHRDLLNVQAEYDKLRDKKPDPDGSALELRAKIRELRMEIDMLELDRQTALWEADRFLQSVSPDL